MRTFKLFMIIGVLFSSFSLMSQIEAKEIQKDLITTFLKEQGASDSEITRLQCEFSLLYEQYTEEDKVKSGELLLAFKSILKSYRETGDIDISHRLFELEHVTHNPHAKVNNVAFTFDASRSKGKPLPDDGSYEKATSCVNSDLETGNFDGWSLAHSTFGGAATIMPGSDIGAMNGLTGNHAIMGPGAGMDPRTGNNLPRVFPGGGDYSIRVGDQNTGYQGASASYTFTVTPATELFLYHFAVVLEDNGHTVAEQPYMDVTLVVDGVSEPCGDYYQAASGSAPGYQTYIPGGFFGTPVRYKMWETVSIALTPYMGQVATVTFTTQDCLQEGHYGYAYVDAQCMAMPTLNDVFLTCANPTATLEAPEGAVSYNWTGPGIVGANNQRIITANAAGLYEVTVIPTGGIACAYTLQTTVIDEIGMVTADFNAIPDEICLGETISFENNTIVDALGGTLQTSNWAFGDGNTSTNFEPTHTYAAPGIYTVELSVETSTGCLDVITKDVTVSPIPVPDFNIPSVCLGTNSIVNNLSNVNSTNGDVIVSWAWDFGDGQTSTAENPTLTYASEGVYTVRLTVETNNGCSFFVENQTEVYPNPVADFSHVEVCSEFNTVFTDLSSVSNAHTTNTINSWNWDFGDGATSTQQNPSHLYPNDGTYNTELVVSTSNGCTHSVSLPVEVFPVPTADFTFVNACDNEAVILESTALPNAGVISDYEWDIGNNGTVDYTTSTANHIFSTTGSHSVSHTVISSYGCSHTITRDVMVYSLPVANFTVDAVCEDATTTFSNTSTISPVDGDVISDYDWSFGDGNTSAIENPTHDYGAENVYNAKLVISSNYGCKDSITLPVNVYPNPVIDFSQIEVCSEFNTVFTDLSSVSNAHTTNTIDQWNWSFGDGATSTQQNPSHLFPNDGAFTTELEAVTNHGCRSSDTRTVNVFPVPTADFTFVNACDNEAVALTSTASPNAGVITDYVWDIDNNGSTDYTTTNVSHVYNSDGAHTVSHTVISSYGCSHTITRDVMVYALPVAGYTVDAVCEDATTTFTSTSSISSVDNDIITNYAWSFGDGNTSAAQNPTHNYGNENVYNAELVVTTNYGCQDVINQPVTVYPLPIPDFTPTSVCLNDRSNFSDISTVSNDHTSNSIVQWSWDFGDGRTSTQQNPYNDYQTDGTFSASLNVVTNHGCAADIVKTVTVHPLPEVSFTGVNLEGCSPICPEVTSTSIINSPSTIASYQWTLSNGETYQGAVMSDCLTNPTGSSVLYGLTLRAVSNEGCVTSHTENNYIEVYHQPIADFYFEPSKPSVLETEVKFFNNSFYADTYEWTFGNQGSSTNANPIFDFTPEPLEHVITLVAKTLQGCTDTVRIVLDIEDKIIFYVPNTFTPDNDDYNEVFKPVFSQGVDPQGYTLYIFNRWGELIFESHDTDIGWRGTYGPDNNQIIRDGTYIWKIIFKESMSDKHHTHTGHVNLLR